MGLTVMGLSPIHAVGAVIAFLGARFLYEGYKVRSRVKAIKAQGIPVLPHSWLFGHLPILGVWRAENPPDANFTAFQLWLTQHCKEYFPGYDYPPAVVYLDIWPVLTPLALVYDPITALQLTQTPSLPKAEVSVKFLEPLTSGIDIASNDGAEWKAWRTRFNPGFSPRNLLAMLPELIDEISIFSSLLEKSAGSGGKWGPVFQLEIKTINLTFDIICKASLGMPLGEQLRPEPSPLKIAMMDQIRVLAEGAKSARALPFGRMPWDILTARRNNRILREILLPEIQNKLRRDAGSSQNKSIIDIALRNIGADGHNGDFIDKLVSNIKAFLFAGHDTTSSSICFMFKLLQDNPKCLAKLRAEHDAVLGSDPERAADVLKQSPHLIYSLAYTLGTIKETLRLYPLASTVRAPPPGYRLTEPDSSISYPVSDFGLWLSTPGIGRHPKYWPQPDEFIPERWMAAEGDPLKPVHNSAWAPFSLGPRNCIGMELALTELRIVSALVARRFDIEQAWDKWDALKGSKATPNAKMDGERLYPAGNSTVHPRDGMPVHVRLREHVPAPAS
ncbi:vera protein [Xylaria nigripes]|nr:vera protein [Xylaria nigripes]